MTQDQLDQRLQSYAAWRDTLIQTIQRFQTWLEDHELATPEQEFRIFEAIEALRKDRLTIAFVAEFSRGKTELINALFFAHYGQRLLPSEAGRTTMCPTELFYERDSGESYIRLLPIETRTQNQSIAEFKHEPIHWTQINLQVNKPDQVSSALHEVVKTKQVPLEKARELGLYDENTDPYFRAHGKSPDQVEIPYWRHAMISFPHELLKQGLVVLDTPGLNAMGNEPELTLSMLPAAQAVMFLLGADTGVTRSDMDMWEHHVNTVRQQANKNLVVVLNKIDTLWDELKDSATINASIEVQCKASAEQLRVDREQVFPLSAQKALIAKIREDEQLLRDSRLPELERFLTETVLPGKQEIVRNDLVSRIGGLINDNLAVLETRNTELTGQLAELHSLRGKNADVIMHLMSKSREEQAAYLRNVESFQNSRRLLQNQARNMLESLSMDTLDRLINNARENMTHSWTTTGMKRGMETFFDGARDSMEQVSSHAEQTRMLVRATYRKFHEEHGLPQITPKQFSIGTYSVELERLYQEADSFRRSPITTMTQQSFVIKKFFISLVSHTRSLFYKANQDADIWLKEVMTPLVRQIKEHKTIMERRLETLRRISDSRDTLEARIKELDAELGDTSKQLDTLQQIRHSINTPLPGT
ncbi:MAG: dynamin family protein, partial [Pseudomonadota bacterium]|nr:dynamin family protein [Pseudomonadota bacterium]